MLGLPLLPLVFSASFAFPLTPEQGIAERIKQWRPDDPQNVWELGGEFEGDIVLPQDDVMANITGRNGVIDPRKRWPNNELPYELDPVFNVKEQQIIHDAVKIFGQKTCVKVRPKRASDKDYVYVTGEPSGCHSTVGRFGGAQNLNLQVGNPGCLHIGTIQHEFLHALGFYHQQSATDRDNYVTILWNNIEGVKQFNFMKYGNNMITDFGVEYDYGSVMHYSAYAFSSNGQKTIATKDPKAVIGQRKGPSERDIEKLRLMYKC